MKFFFPDSQDLVDPSFDFERETRSDTRVRQRDDLYAHEVFANVPFNGMLISKGIVDGLKGATTAKYTMAQRNRLMRVGAREFLRIGNKPLELIGDCGAFSYVAEDRPPYSVDDVVDFYDTCGFDYGISVDHVVLGYDPAAVPGDPQTREWQRRQGITLELADDFRRRHKAQKSRFHPMGVAQGWSPASYAHAVVALQKMGYRYIALGGMVPLKTKEILETLASIDRIRKPETGFHLLGVTRTEHLREFAGYGVVSFDSTSPLRQAFKDEDDNYYTMDRTYSAVRVPQVEANPKLLRRIKAGEVDQSRARKLELACLDLLVKYDTGHGSLEAAVEAVAEYERLHDGKKDRTERYREVLSDAPWKDCRCEVCQQLGIHVILFRGAERNRRRGFHNVMVFSQRLQAVRGRIAKAPRAAQVNDVRL